MNLPFIIIILSIFIFFISLYALSKDDFVLTRRSVAVNKIFDLALLTIIFAAVFARALFVVLASEWSFLNPFLFLDIFYHKGLVLSGAIIGGVLSLTYFLIRKKLPIGRINDLFSTAAAFALSVGFLGNLVLIFASRMFSILFLVNSVVFLIFGILMAKILVRAKIKDGSITLLLLLLFSALTIVSSTIQNQKFVTGPENIILLGVVVVSIFFLIRGETFKKT